MLVQRIDRVSVVARPMLLQKTVKMHQNQEQVAAVTLKCHHTANSCGQELMLSSKPMPVMSKVIIVEHN